MLTPVPPDVCPTGRYTVTQTYKMLGICKATLQSYTNRGLIKAVFVTKPTFRRMYTGREILRFWHSVK